MKRSGSSVALFTPPPHTHFLPRRSTNHRRVGRPVTLHAVVVATTVVGVFLRQVFQHFLNRHEYGGASLLPTAPAAAARCVRLSAYRRVRVLDVTSAARFLSNRASGSLRSISSRMVGLSDSSALKSGSAVFNMVKVLPLLLRVPRQSAGSPHRTVPRLAR
jgi:hypothetical protein